MFVCVCRYALAFNEPDQPAVYGGSAMGVSDAVSLFKQYMTPLAAKGIKLGTPACSNADSGTQWLQQFMAACSDCSIGFIVTHYYGNAVGLKAHMENLHSLFPTYDLWLTEWADAHDTLASTETETAAMYEFLDNASYIPHHFYFGAVRASTLNIGANAALLSDSGDLTPLGSSYVSGGGSAPPASSYAAPSFTKPTSTSVYVAPTSFYVAPTTVSVAPTSVYVAPTVTQDYVVATPYLAGVTHTTLKTSTTKGVTPKKTSTKCTSTTKTAKKSKHRHHTRTTVAPAAYKTVVVSEVVTKTMTHWIYDKY